jgi:hypothetical protein
MSLLHTVPQLRIAARALGLGLLFAGSAGPLAAQADTARRDSTPAGAPRSDTTSTGVARVATAPGIFSSAGAARAELAVNQVYIDRNMREARVDGGDFASHLLERLGVKPVPDGLAMRVAVDTTAVRISGRVRDLPAETRAMLGSALALLDPNSLLTANVGLTRDGPGIMRFKLRSISVDGFPLPEMLLVPMMAEVGRQVPVLTRTGRDLLVAIPPDGVLRLENGAIRLIGPPAGTPASAPRKPAATPGTSASAPVRGS